MLAFLGRQSKIAARELRQIGSLCGLYATLEGNPILTVLYVPTKKITVLIRKLAATLKFLGWLVTHHAISSCYVERRGYLCIILSSSWRTFKPSKNLGRENRGAEEVHDFQRAKFSSVGAISKKLIKTAQHIAVHKIFLPIRSDLNYLESSS